MESDAGNRSRQSRPTMTIGHVNFKRVAAGHSRHVTFKVSNSTSSPLTINRAHVVDQKCYVANGDPRSFTQCALSPFELVSSPTLPFVVKEGTTSLFSIRFQPQWEGQFYAVLELHLSDEKLSQCVYLSGEGKPSSQSPAKNATGDQGMLASPVQYLERRVNVSSPAHVSAVGSAHNMSDESVLSAVRDPLSGDNRGSRLVDGLSILPASDRDNSTGKRSESGETGSVLLSLSSLKDQIEQETKDFERLRSMISDELSRSAASRSPIPDNTRSESFSQPEPYSRSYQRLSDAIPAQNEAGVLSVIPKRGEDCKSPSGMWDTLLQSTDSPMHRASPARGDIGGRLRSTTGSDHGDYLSTSDVSMRSMRAETQKRTSMVDEAVQCVELVSTGVQASPETVNDHHSKEVKQTPKSVSFNIDGDVSHRSSNGRQEMRDQGVGVQAIGRMKQSKSVGGDQSIPMWNSPVDRAVAADTPSVSFGSAPSSFASLPANGTPAGGDPDRVSLLLARLQLLMESGPLDTSHVSGGHGSTFPSTTVLNAMYVPLSGTESDFPRFDSQFEDSAKRLEHEINLLRCELINLESDVASGDRILDASLLQSLPHDIGHPTSVVDSVHPPHEESRILHKSTTEADDTEILRRTDDESIPVEPPIGLGDQYVSATDSSPQLGAMSGVQPGVEALQTPAKAAAGEDWFHEMEPSPGDVKEENARLSVWDTFLTHGQNAYSPSLVSLTEQYEQMALNTPAPTTRGGRLRASSPVPIGHDMSDSNSDDSSTGDRSSALHGSTQSAHQDSELSRTEIHSVATSMHQNTPSISIDGPSPLASARQSLIKSFDEAKDDDGAERREHVPSVSPSGPLTSDVFEDASSTPFTPKRVSFKEHVMFDSIDPNSSIWSMKTPMKTPSRQKAM